MLFLQNLPTAHWSNDDISLLLAEAYRLKYMFADAPRHFNQQVKRWWCIGSKVADTVIDLIRLSFVCVMSIDYRLGSKCAWRTNGPDITWMNLVTTVVSVLLHSCMGCFKVHSSVSNLWMSPEPHRDIIFYSNMQFIWSPCLSPLVGDIHINWQCSCCWQ